MSNYRDHVPGAFTDDYDWWDDWGIDDEAEVSVYIHRDAARAWQAFRDWLDGTAADWMREIDNLLYAQYLSDVKDGMNK